MNLNKASSELRLVAILVVATLVLGIVSIYLAPAIFAQDRSGDTVESYTVTLHSDGTLDETFVYNIVARDTRFLFRYWEEAVYTLGGSTTINPHLEVISITGPPDTTTYLKNDVGQVTLYSGSDIYTIQDLAYMNEVGAYNPNYYQPGKYTVSYKYKLSLPVDTDGSYDHLNLQFANQHITYGSVKIVIEDADKTAAIYQHPPSLQLSRSGNEAIITGNSAENELLEVEMLAQTANSPWRTWAMIYHETNTKTGTEAANQAYSTQYWTAYSVNIAGKAAVVLVPLLIFGLWYRFGREEDAVVPSYLSTVPNPERKPW